MLPPPVTILPSSIATATTLMASSRDRSTSSMTCSVPPLSSRDTALGFLQPVTKVISSSPSWRTSIREAQPSSSAESSSILVTTVAPVALASFSMSDFLTRRTAKIFSLARKCWARSSMPFWQKTDVGAGLLDDGDHLAQHVLFLVEEGLHLGRDR